jgi:VIT1/CCC1 family predicted Fe2+/Mn2+ transporter
MFARFGVYARNELFDSLLYEALSKHERNPRNKEILEELSRQEYMHYEFWSKFAGKIELEPRELFKLKFFLLLSRVLGRTFIIKFLERHETRAVEVYSQILGKEPLTEEDRRTLARVIEDEKFHEGALSSQIDEFAVRHLGSIALGMSDAIIELSGVHAGFLGYTSSSLYTGISGLIVGISASLSMAAAAYLQAKQERGKSPGKSAAVTGLMYMATVVLLTSPFFAGLPLLTALSISVALALVVLAGFTFYSTTILGSSFAREFLENSGVILLVVLVGYLFGTAVERILGFRP